MRKIANLQTPKDEIVRAMIFDNGTGAYLFLYNSAADGPCAADQWYESISDAEAVCVEEYGISTNDWKNISDPKPGCQHDWINPTRVKRDSAGKKLWGKFEPATDTV